MSNETFFAVCVDRFNTGIPVYVPFTTKPAAEQHAADMNKKVIAEQYLGKVQFPQHLRINGDVGETVPCLS